MVGNEKEKGYTSIKNKKTKEKELVIVKFDHFYVDVSKLPRAERIELANRIHMQSFMVLHLDSFLLSNMDGFEFLANTKMTCEEAMSAFMIPSNCTVRGVRI